MNNGLEFEQELVESWIHFSKIPFFRAWDSFYVGTDYFRPRPPAQVEQPFLFIEVSVIDYPVFEKQSLHDAGATTSM